MNEMTMKANRLATIHKDLMTVTEAISRASSSVRSKSLSIKAASEEYHAVDTDKVSERLDRMTLHTTDLGHGLRKAIRTAIDAYAFQRDRCKRNKADFVHQGAVIEDLTDNGVFQELVALHKAAKAEATNQVGEVVVEPGVYGEVTKEQHETGRVDSKGRKVGYVVVYRDNGTDFRCYVQNTRDSKEFGVLQYSESFTSAAAAKAYGAATLAKRLAK